MKLEGRTALVTGGGSGISGARSRGCSPRRARVFVNDIALDRAHATVEAMGARGAAARAVVADVADSAQVRAMFAEIDRDGGGLDVLVNNAGVAEGVRGERERIGARAEARIQELISGQGIQTHLDVTQDLIDESWHRVIGVHLHGTFYCTREALRLMARRNRGAIVNMSSVAALMGLDSVPHYSAAKAGILGLTRAVAREVASRGIRVNAICPGYIDTPMTEGISPLSQKAILARTPLGRMAEPREVAATALFLASDDSSYFTGQWLSPNGGLFIG